MVIVAEGLFRCQQVLSVCHLYISDLDFIIAVVADVVGSNGTRPPGNKMVFGKFFIVIQFKHVYACHSDIQNTLTH